MTDLETSAKEGRRSTDSLSRVAVPWSVQSSLLRDVQAARAMLIARGHPIERVKTHKSVLRLFSDEFVRDGSFNVELARALRKAADARHLADYEGGVTEAEAAQVMATLEAFMGKAIAVLSKTAGRQEP
jgi:hypothetical protein